VEDKMHPSDLWSGGLIAFGLVILQGFFSSNSVNAAGLVSVFAFAVAIPILSCNLLMNFVRRNSGKHASICEILFYFGGMLAALFGVGAAFWHTCWISALVFAASSLVAFIVFLIVRS
jgi:hypothetical protein